MIADFADETVVITGASGGIGRVLARRYARRGANVALVARRSEELSVTADVIAAEGGGRRRCMSQTCAPSSVA